MVGSETVTRIRSTDASSRDTQNTDTSHQPVPMQWPVHISCSILCQSQFTIPDTTSQLGQNKRGASQTGINKQSVWREQESRIHFATQKKFNVNKQCITALSTLHLWLTTTCLIQPDSWWTLWTRPSIMMAAAPTPQRENVTYQLTDAEVTVYQPHGVSFKPRNNASSTHFIPLKVISNNK